MSRRVSHVPTLGVVALAGVIAVCIPAAAAAPGPAPTAEHREPTAATCYANVDDLDDFRTMSQNFAPVLDAYDSAAADDVSLTKACTIRSIQVIGAASAEDAVDSETVTIYRDSGGRPGKVVSSQTVVGTDRDGSFDIRLDPVRLKKGTYWVSVVANLDSEAGGQWYWTHSNTERGAAALWQNPNGGWQYGCRTWTRIQQCLGSEPGADLSFALSRRR